MQEYWHKQTDKPLFPDLLWARPETKHTAGKLLIVGGHAQSFAAPAEAYAAAQKAGIGTTHVILPSSLERTVGSLFPEATFAPGNPSGGFASDALAEVLAAATWADGVLLAGDLGRNSETTAMLENFASKFPGQLTITKDVGDFFCTQPTSLLGRPGTLLVISIGQLQRLGLSLRTSRAFTSDLGIVQLVELLHELTLIHPELCIITRQASQYVVAIAGAVNTTPAPPEQTVWRVNAAATAATWWLQNPTKPFQAITTSLLNQA